MIAMIQLTNDTRQQPTIPQRVHWYQTPSEIQSSLKTKLDDEFHSKMPPLLSSDLFPRFLWSNDNVPALAFCCSTATTSRKLRHRCPTAAATGIQRVWRGTRQRALYRAQRAVLTRLQAVVRARQQRRRYLALRRAATLVQACRRRTLAYRQLVRPGPCALDAAPPPRDSPWPPPHSLMSSRSCDHLNPLAGWRRNPSNSKKQPPRNKSLAPNRCFRAFGC
jgi:hypothetical protein